MPIWLIPLAMKYWKAAVLGAAILAVGALAIHERNRYLEIGRQEELKRIKDANDANERKADQSTRRLEDCMRRGGDWDRDASGGVCHEPGPRP